MQSFLERYRLGDFDAVWADLRKLGPEARDPDHYTDVWAVCQEAMRRVRRNVEEIIARLSRSGYEFTDPWDGTTVIRPHAPPTEDSRAFANWLEGLEGTLPLTARAWIEGVGDVNLMGNHPRWPEREMYTDALVIEFEYRTWALGDDAQKVREHYQTEHDWWNKDGASGEYGPRQIDVAPDVYHKVNVSGGAPYGIIVPDPSADAAINLDGAKMYFVDYLRECFQWGGFPGFGVKEKGRDNGTVRELAEGLLAI